MGRLIKDHKKLKTKRRIKIIDNPTERERLENSSKRERTNMVAQEAFVEETIRKVGQEKLLTIGEIIDISIYGDLSEAFNERKPRNVTRTQAIRL